MKQTAGNVPEQSETSLQELVRIVWSGRILILCIGATFALAAGLAGWHKAPEYQATTILSPVTNNPANGQLGALSSLTSQFGGLASLAGISVASDSKKAESVAVLQSEALTERYIERNNLLPVLYRKIWDATKGGWKTADAERIPTLWKANQFFKRRIRTVTTDTKSGLVTLTVRWTDPKLAAKWANDLVKMTNEYLRDQAIRESERNIVYLTDQATKTEAVGAKQAIYTILQTEINKVMLARGNEEYALKVIDPAFAPERPSSLGVLGWVFIGLLGGLLLAVAIVVVRHGLSRA